MRLYSFLGSIGPLRNSYARKFLFVAFLGIHVPLIGVSLFLLFYERHFTPMAMLVFILVLTLLATFATLLFLKKLLMPVELSSTTLSDFRKTRAMPKLPSGHTDEVGLLMKNIVYVLLSAESNLQQKQQALHILSGDIRKEAARLGGLEQKLRDRKVHDLADELKTTSGRIVDFIESFATLSKKEDDLTKKSLKVRRYDFAEIAKNLEKQFGDALVQKNIKLSVKLPNESVHLKADSALLFDVLSDLLGNAIKFSNEGGKIDFIVTRERGLLSIVVRDYGRGIDNPSEIFQKMRLTVDDGHSPVGLYFCRLIMHKFEGSLVAESKGEGKGTTFIAELPAYRPNK